MACKSLPVGNRTRAADRAKASLADRQIAMAMSMAIPSAKARATRRATPVAGAHRVRVNPIPCRQRWDFRLRRKVGGVREVDRANVTGRAMHGAATAKVRRAIHGLPIATVPACPNAAGHAAEEWSGAGYSSTEQGASKISD
jgi:hypothetical protein